MSKIRALYCWTWLFSLSFVLLSQCAFSQAVYPKSAESFTFQNEQVSAGSKKHFTVEISSDEHTTTMPITIFQGSQEGPVVGITTGVHGYEYAPILAGQQLIKKINPKDLKGTLILVQIANVESFLNRSPYFNPQDGKNLNRVFPGSESGTITEKLAHFITTEIISKCDYFVDIHSGDAPEDLMPYAAYYQHDDMPDISIKGKQMASYMGFDHIVTFKTTGKDYMKKNKPSLYCSAEAFKQGIPSVDIECGRLGIVEEETVAQISDGVESLLVHLSMMEGELIEIPSIAHIEDRHSQSSKHRGFFYPNKTSGDFIIKGMKIGEITDFFGNVMDTVYAEESGVILYMIGTPPINKGETLVNIGKIVKE